MSAVVPVISNPFKSRKEINQAGLKLARQAKRKRTSVLMTIVVNKIEAESKAQKTRDTQDWIEFVTEKISLIASAGIMAEGSLAGSADDATKIADDLAGVADDVVAQALPEAEIGTKLDYVFGKATGSAHNIERSTGMLRQLQSIGIFDNAVGRAILNSHLKDVFKNGKAILQSNGRYLRESLLMGPNGAVKVESIWEGNRLITVKLLGGK